MTYPNNLCPGSLTGQKLRSKSPPLKTDDQQEAGFSGTRNQQRYVKITLQKREIESDVLQEKKTK
jgi:hypothetical protein